MHFRYLLLAPLLFVFVSNSGFALQATYYSDSLEGGLTANGNIFSQNTHSLAACDIPLGQYGYISRGGTGIVATIDDRPNCSKYPNLVDLSRTVFQVFSPTRVGNISDVFLTSV